MANRSLTELLQEHAAAGLTRLQFNPPLARQGMDLLAEGAPTATALVEMINQDPVLTCDLFRTANSAFYQGLPKVRTLHEAITRIGLEHAAAAAQQSCQAGALAPPGRLFPRYLPPLWQHARGCALGARWLANRCGYRTLADHAYLAGLLHDIGKFSLLATLEQIACCGGTGIALSHQLVEEVLESRHSEEGLRLMAEWNLPDDFATVVGRHHEAGLEGQDLVVILVKLANQGCRKLGLGWKTDPQLVLPTTAEAQFLGIDEISLAEYEIMLEDYFGLVSGSPPGTETAIALM